MEVFVKRANCNDVRGAVVETERSCFVVGGYSHTAQRAITIDEMLAVTGTEIGSFQVAPELRSSIQDQIDAFQLPAELSALGERTACGASKCVGVETLSMACPAAGERATIIVLYSVGILKKIDEVYQTSRALVPKKLLWRLRKQLGCRPKSRD